ncbi:hypothetical protein LCGC14_0334680 [marine sediment metagenome]|uniref:Uncharacterized protein n=1 Tax=marine sediment metagenome TaxID=412755 RepID=A0A0F9TFG0_9ZZZZ
MVSPAARVADGAEMLRLGFANRVSDSYFTPPWVVGDLRRDSESIKGFPEHARETLPILARKIYDRFIAPSLTSTSTSGEFMEFVMARRREFQREMRAFGSAVASLAPVSLESVSPESEYMRVSESEIREMLLGGLTVLVGEKGAREVRFAMDTHQRASQLAARTMELDPPTEEPEQREDHFLCGKYNYSTALFAYGMMCFGAIHLGVEPKPKVLGGVFVMTRYGALDSYSCARRLFDLRAPQRAKAVKHDPPRAVSAEELELLDYGLDEAEELLRPYDASE